MATLSAAGCDLTWSRDLRVADPLLRQRLAALKAEIAASQIELGLPLESVGLVAVSKTHPASAVLEAKATGHHDFGENYVQEGVAKVQAVAAADANAHLLTGWHFIGPLQSNKTREVATHFEWVHSIDRPKIAQRLADQRPDGLPPLQVCLQVNISAQPSKSGVAAADTLETFLAIAAISRAFPERIQLRGLMAIPSPQRLADPNDPNDPNHPSNSFDRLLNLLMTCWSALDAKQQDAAGPPVASIGMSDDWLLALAAQARARRETSLHSKVWLRIGSSIFGARPSP